MTWQEWVKTILMALLPVLYFILQQKYPDAPFSQEQFVEIIMWIIETAFFTKLAYKLYLVKRLGMAKNKLFSYSFLLW